MRIEAAKAIGNMGPAVNKCKGFSRLVNALLDPDEAFRKEVAKAIKKISD